MKLGTMVHFNSIDDIEKKFKIISENGLYTCQLDCWNPVLMTEENAEIIKGLSEKYSVVISALWCGWEGPKVWDFYDGQLTLGLVPIDFRRMRIQNLCKGSDFAKMLGVSDVITHMGFIPENPLDPNFNTFCISVREVAEYCKANGQYLLFEAGQETPVTMLRCFETVGTDNLGVNLDTANVILYGKANPVDALDVFGKYVRNIHAKDGFYPTNGHDLGKEVPLGEGKVDFKAFFAKLKELEYDRFVTIEIELAEGEKQFAEVMHAKEYLENIITEIYGGNALC